jgi:hypothetical protein
MTVRDAPARRSTKVLSEHMDVERATPETRRHAACVLEVLAGLRTPEEAACVLGISMPTYYNLEARALRGLLHGCHTESPGRKLALEKRLKDAQARVVELERQLQRYRAVLRNARRAAEILGPDSPAKASETPSRAPRVRALRAIEALGAKGTTPGAGAGAGAAARGRRNARRPRLRPRPRPHFDPAATRPRPEARRRPPPAGRRRPPRARGPGVPAGPEPRPAGSCGRRAWRARTSGDPTSSSSQRPSVGKRFPIGRKKEGAGWSPTPSPSGLVPGRQVPFGVKPMTWTPAPRTMSIAWMASW